VTVFQSCQELERAILEVARRKAKEFQLYHNYMVIEEKKNRLRLIDSPKKYIRTPAEWSESKLFNPFYTIKHAKYLASRIYQKLQAGTYNPSKPYVREIPKSNGKVRLVSTYQIPDDAISRQVFSQLLSKNKHRFSGLSYAYRDDRNAHFAIQDISQDLSKYPRMFVAEFDFSDFFNSISHSYLLEQLDKNSFSISEAEIVIIKSFLNKGNKGVPQGTSISLFLANVACWNLDRNLERQGVRFARYADDTLIWSDSYEKICATFNVMHDFSLASGVAINARKSDGISLLSEQGYSSEIKKNKTFVNFLGYNITHKHVGIKDTSLKKIKSQVSYLLYKNLIQPLKEIPFNAQCNPTTDDEAAFASAIHQIRRYIYGDLTEFTLASYIQGNYKHLQFKGVMSYYPLVTDDEQLKGLDQWVVSTILNVLKLRNKLLTPIYGNQSAKFPYYLKANTIIKECKKRRKYVSGKGLVKAFELPSFMRINRAIRIGMKNEGILAVVKARLDSYDY